MHFFKVGAEHSNPGPRAYVTIALLPSSCCKILKYGLQVGKHLIFVYPLADERDEEVWGISLLLVICWMPGKSEAGAWNRQPMRICC